MSNNYNTSSAWGINKTDRCKSDNTAILLFNPSFIFIVKVDAF